MRAQKVSIFGRGFSAEDTNGFHPAYGLQAGPFGPGLQPVDIVA
jgi:hypothetical protein